MQWEEAGIFGRHFRRARQSHDGCYQLLTPTPLLVPPYIVFIERRWPSVKYEQIYSSDYADAAMARRGLTGY